MAGRSGTAAARLISEIRVPHATAAPSLCGHLRTCEMAISSAWNLADGFTVIQAAYLWNQIEPPENSAEETIRRGGRPASVAAIVQAFQSANGRSFTILYRDDVAEMMNDLFATEISREELIGFAKSKGQYPAFLFDTLGPTNNELPQQISNSPPMSSNEARDAVSAASSSIETEVPKTTKNKGGRPPEYDWDGAISEIVRVAELDGLPKTQASMVRHLKSWFANQSLTVPGETQIKARVSTIYQRLGAAGCTPSREVSD